MKLIKPSQNAPAKSQTMQGQSGIPSWRREWIENKYHGVELACGHKEDLHDNAITLINSFSGCQVDCVKCGKFVAVKRPIRPAKVTYPATPMF